ncbi:hypothetical protein KM043_009437 [Ampulex compressa]|nr:hypothetical protein KM043_009437 [Ampulex compressa]
MPWLGFHRETTRASLEATNALMSVDSLNFQGRTAGGGPGEPRIEAPRNILITDTLIAAQDSNGVKKIEGNFIYERLNLDRSIWMKDFGQGIGSRWRIEWFKIKHARASARCCEYSKHGGIMVSRVILAEISRPVSIRTLNARGNNQFPLKFDTLKAAAQENYGDDFA